MLVISALACLTPVACDSADPHTTAVVDSVADRKLCVTPEDQKQTDLVGCYAVSPVDQAKLRAGMCIELRIPSQFDDKHRNEVIYGLHVLHRRCKRHG